MFQHSKRHQAVLSEFFRLSNRRFIVLPIRYNLSDEAKLKRFIGVDKTVLEQDLLGFADAKIPMVQ